MPLVIRAGMISRALVALAVASISAAVLGCSDPPAPLQPGAVFEVGTGEGTFEALGPDAKVPIVYGFQGGEHIWFAARCRGLGPQAILTYSIDDERGEVVSGEQEVMLPDDPDDDGWRTISGLTAFVFTSVSQGTHVVFKGHLEDDAGHEMDAAGPAIVEGEEEPF